MRATGDKMAVCRASNFGNPFIGLFAKSSDRLAACDASCSPKLEHALGALGVPIAKLTFGGAMGLCGIFLAMNSNGAVVPSFCSREEVSALKRHGLEVEKLSGPFSAAGNNIAANDHGALVNPAMPRKEIRKVSDCLGVEAVPMRVAGYSTPGSCVAATNKGFAAHNRATSEELKELEAIFRVSGLNCTVLTGIPFVPLGLVANSSAAVFGESATGFEIGRASEALGLQ
jgi:translation initiation factor 6